MGREGRLRPRRSPKRYAHHPHPPCLCVALCHAHFSTEAVREELLPRRPANQYGELPNMDMARISPCPVSTGWLFKKAQGRAIAGQRAGLGSGRRWAAGGAEQRERRWARRRRRAAGGAEQRSGAGHAAGEAGWAALAAEGTEWGSGRRRAGERRWACSGRSGVGGAGTPVGGAGGRRGRCVPSCAHNASRDSCDACMQYIYSS